MFRLPNALFAALICLCSSRAFADEAQGAPGPGTAAPLGTHPADVEQERLARLREVHNPGFSERLVLETGRSAAPAPSANTVRFTVQGEYQLRFRTLSDLRLGAPVTSPQLTSLDQNRYLYHWARFNPRLQFGSEFAVVGQIDLPRGMVLGDTTKLVGMARDSYSESAGFEVHPRWLYLEVNAPFGVFRVGQQGSHWGMGILANDGDHRSLFGDYQRGALVERALFASRPLGENIPLVIAAAGDIVFEDNTADLLDQGDFALQGVLAAQWKTKRTELGVYGALRRQTRAARSSGDEGPGYNDRLWAAVIDVAGKFNAPIPDTRAHLFGEMEAALIFGETTFARAVYGSSVESGEARDPERIRSFGAAAKVGVVHVAERGPKQFGRIVAQIEWGFASGDANPFDGVNKRFVFDPNHNVGLVLFDQVLNWKTARSATLLGDPALVRRPVPGVDFLPSNGGIFGTNYLNPTFVIRPFRWLDLKGGFVIAQASADVVDPYRTGVLGSFVNYDGGDDRNHDLGLEMDIGADARFSVGESLIVEAGVEGGAFFPGHAFDSRSGRGLDNAFLVNSKLGVNF